MVTLANLVEDNRDSLPLEWLAGRDRAGDALPESVSASASVATSDLVGHLNLIHPNRLHVLGAPEVRYIARMDAARIDHYANELIAGAPLGLIVAEGLAAPPGLLAAAQRAGLPVLATPLPASQVIDLLRIYLAKVLAAHCTMHGVFMDVLGMGVLISGDQVLPKITTNVSVWPDQPRGNPLRLYWSA